VACAVVKEKGALVNLVFSATLNSREARLRPKDSSLIIL
jgi:hypothetical protein